MTTARRKVLLVGWDAADWRIIQPLLDRGELPVLEKIITGGVMGNLSSIRPMLSPMLWNSIATGKRPFKHGVHGFTEVDYELNQIVPVSSTTRKCKAVWNILNERGLKTHVVGWFATHPAEPLDGSCVSDRFASPAPAELDAEWKLPKHTIHPARLEDTLADLRLRPEEVPGDVLGMFVRNAARINQAHDKRLHQLAIHLAECFSVHAAATYLLEHEPWDFAAIYYRAIDWLCHHFMEFHPPARAGIYEQEFAHYHDVVQSAYRLHDLMLGRLLQLAGENVTVIVVSDHGFKSGAQRPISTPNVPAGIAAWHRLNGILAMRGEGLRSDELIHGANLLDITPTILALFGLPIAADMDGRVLVEAFSRTPEVERIESWEKTETTSARISLPANSPNENKELIRQFIEIGYINDPGDNLDEAIRSTERENRWALAQSYLSAARFADALPLLESVYEDWPERWDFRRELALCQLNLGLIDEAHETLGEILEDGKRPAALLMRAHIAYRRKDFVEGLKFLEEAEALDSASAGLQNQIGLTRLRLHQPQLAEIAFRKAIENDPDDAYAYAGVAFCRLRGRAYQEAAEFALQSIGLRFDLAIAHHHLGVALARLGNDSRAIQAFEACLRYQPAWIAAHRYLAVIYSRQRQSENAQRHHDYLRGRILRRQKWIAFQKTMRREIAERARQRGEARQQMRARARQTATTSKKSPSASTEFLIVSGLPRSGTSLMMQMLEAAGLPIMRDESRPADESNPRGYFEWQEIKKLPGDPHLIEQTHGRVTKVVSMLLPSLLRQHRFRIIFMQRDIADVADSQRKMRQRLTGNSLIDQEQMQSHLSKHRDRMLELLRESPNVELLEVSYEAILRNPAGLVGSIAEFAGIAADRHDAMLAVIDPSLCHSAARLTKSVA